MIKITYLLGLPGLLLFSSSTLLRSKKIEALNNRKKRASTLNLRLMDIGAEDQMQTIPTAPLLAPLLAPLSGHSSPSSSFFLDQTTETAGKQPHKRDKPEDGWSLLWVDDEEDEADGVSIDEGRPPEKSHWSDDSDVDEDEDGEDGRDKEDDSGVSVTSTTDVNAKDQEADEQNFKVGERNKMAAAALPEETRGEEAELSGNTHAESACLLDRNSKKDERIS